MNYLSPEYKATHCIQCAKPLIEHRLYTQADVDASKGATYDNSRNGYRSPMSPTVIGKLWVNGHAPMTWSSPKGGAK